MNFDSKRILSRKIPDFYKEIFVWFKAFHVVGEPEGPKEIRQQRLWHNSRICVQDRSLVGLARVERQIALIEDLLDSSGNFLDYRSFLLRHDSLSVNILAYNSWCRAIPVSWRRSLLNSTPLTQEEREEKSMFRIKEKNSSLHTVRSNYFYRIQIPEVVPRGQQRLEEKGFNFGSGWGEIYKQAFQITASTKLQSLQYRIMQRFFPTKRFLCIRKVVDNRFCDNCG